MHNSAKFDNDSLANLSLQAPWWIECFNPSAQVGQFWKQFSALNSTKSQVVSHLDPRGGINYWLTEELTTLGMQVKWNRA
jgi:hypothetical protein